MPQIDVFNIRDPSKNRMVKYELGSETLSEIVKKYDENASTQTCRLAVGEEAFYYWDIPIEACLEYGDSISIFYHQFETIPFEVKVKTLTGQTLTVSNMYANSTVKEIIEGIGYEETPDGSRIIYRRIKLDEYLNLGDCGISAASNTAHFVLKLRGGGGFIAFALLTEDGQIVTVDTRNWRIVDAGLNLEGRCENRSCEAFNQMVVIQMGASIVYKFGFPNKKPLNCPMCNKNVEPETCGFYNCSFRFLGVMEVNGRPKNYKSDWRDVFGENRYFRFREEVKCKWISLVIETRAEGKFPIARSIACSVCLSSFKDDLQSFSDCEHKVHKR